MEDSSPLLRIWTDETDTYTRLLYRTASEMDCRTESHLTPGTRNLDCCVQQSNGWICLFKEGSPQPDAAFTIGRRVFTSNDYQIPRKRRQCNLETARWGSLLSYTPLCRKLSSFGISPKIAKDEAELALLIINSEIDVAVFEQCSYFGVCGAISVFLRELGPCVYGFDGRPYNWCASNSINALFSTSRLAVIEFAERYGHMFQKT